MRFLRIVLGFVLMGNVCSWFRSEVVNSYSGALPVGCGRRCCGSCFCWWCYWVLGGAVVCDSVARVFE